MEPLEFRKSKQLYLFIAGAALAVMLFFILPIIDELTPTDKLTWIGVSVIALAVALYNYFDRRPQIAISETSIKTWNDFILWDTVAEFSFQFKMEGDARQLGMSLKTLPSGFMVFIPFEGLDRSPQEIAAAVETYVLRSEILSNKIRRADEPGHEY